MKTFSSDNEDDETECLKVNYLNTDYYKKDRLETAGTVY
jgi:hypothetical protein